MKKTSSVLYGVAFLGILAACPPTFADVRVSSGRPAPTYQISGYAGTSGVTVSIGSASTTSDASTRFTLSGVVAGTYTVTPSKSGCGFRPATQSVTVPTNDSVYFEAICGLPLTSGVPLGGQSVAVNATTYYYMTVPADVWDVNFTTTSISGSVSIAAYRRVPRSPPDCLGYQSATGVAVASCSNPYPGTWWISVLGTSPRGSSNFTITGNAKFPTYKISGSAGTVGATITAGSASTTSDASGDYAIYGLDSGPYTVTPSKPGCTFSPASQTVTVFRRPTVNGANAAAATFSATCDFLLTSGVPVSNQTVVRDAWKYYSIVVPAGATALTFQMTTPSQTFPSLYTQVNGRPTSSAFACITNSARASRRGILDCVAKNPGAGTWWAGVYGGIVGSDFTITGTVSTGAKQRLYANGLDSYQGWTTMQPFPNKATPQPEWTFVASATNPNATLHYGTKFAMFNSQVLKGGEALILYTTDSVMIPNNGASTTLTFWMYHDTGAPNVDDNITVKAIVGELQGTSGPPFLRYDGSTGWKQHTFDLTPWSGQTVQLGFGGMSRGGGNNMYIDEMVVTTP